MHMMCIMFGCGSYDESKEKNLHFQQNVEIFNEKLNTSACIFVSMYEHILAHAGGKETQPCN